MNAKKLLSTLLSAAMAVSMLAGCFGGGGNKNYSDEAADAANAAQSTVVFATDAKLSKSLQDALENFTQLDDIKDAMEADENLKSLLTSGYDLDVVAEQGEDAEAAAKAIAEKYILSIVSGKKAEGKIAMVLHDGNGYYYVAVLTYGSGGSGSGGGTGGGSGSGDDHRPGGGDDDEEENGVYAVDAKALDGNGTVEADKSTVKAGETVTITVTPKDGYKIDKIDYAGGTFNYVPTGSGSGSDSLVYTMSNVTGDVKFHVTFFEAAPDTSTVTFTVTGEGTVTNTANNSEIENGDTLEMVPADKMTFKVNPDQNYEAVVTNEGCTVVDNKDGTYTLSNVTDGATVTVSFKEITYEIEVVSSGYANIVAAPSTVPAGGKTEVTIKNVDAGWKVKEVTAEMSDGTTRTLIYDAASGRYILDNIQADAIIHAEFEISEHTITVNITEGEGHGTVTVNPESVEHGKNATYTINPDDKWKIKSLKVGGNSVEITGDAHFGYNGTIENITKDTVIEVAFEKCDFTIAVTTPPDKAEYTEGEPFDPTGMEVVATYEDGYTENVTGKCNFDPSQNLQVKDNKVTVSYTEGSITKTADVEITVSPATYNVYVTIVEKDGGSGSVKYDDGSGNQNISNPGKTFAVNKGDTIELEVSSTSGSESTVVIDGAKKGSDGTYTIKDVTDDVNITITFTKKEPVLKEVELTINTKSTMYEGDSIFYSYRYSFDKRFNPIASKTYKNNLTLKYIYDDTDANKAVEVTGADLEQMLKDGTIKVTYIWNGYAGYQNQKVNADRFTESGYWTINISYKKGSYSDSVTLKSPYVYGRSTWYGDNIPWESYCNKYF